MGGSRIIGWMDGWTQWMEDGWMGGRRGARRQSQTAWDGWMKGRDRRKEALGGKRPWRRCCQGCTARHLLPLSASPPAAHTNSDTQGSGHRNQGTGFRI
eukprot:3276765-Rhodomonas_salina.1